MTSPKTGVVRLRNGLKIFLSSHPHDVVTVFVIFIRRDYGAVSPGGVVVDIGANIGVFTLYAAACGAGAVHAFEPNSESFRQLSRNVLENRLENVVRARRMAVTGTHVGEVKFPKGSSMYNAIIDDDAVQEYENVSSLTLREIITRDPSGNLEVDLLKMDCEGEEYGILFAAEPELFRNIGKIRLEYHKGNRSGLLSFLERMGYRHRFSKEENSRSGILWVERKPAGE
ncbi:MAG: FkbM family methyltransferase [bacterium]|jgi:FkbM family methyltransferase